MMKSIIVFIFCGLIMGGNPIHAGDKIIIPDNLKKVAIVRAAFDRDNDISVATFGGYSVPDELKKIQKEARPLTGEEQKALEDFLGETIQVFTQKLSSKNIGVVSAVSINSITKPELASDNRVVYFNSLGSFVPIKEKDVLEKGLGFFSGHGSNIKVDKEKVEQLCTKLGVDALYFFTFQYKIANFSNLLMAKRSVIQLGISIDGYSKQGEEITTFEGTIESPMLNEYVYLPRPYFDSKHSSVFRQLAKNFIHALPDSLKIGNAWW